MIKFIFLFFLTAQFTVVQAEGQFQKALPPDGAAPIATAMAESFTYQLMPGINT